MYRVVAAWPGFWRDSADQKEMTVGKTACVRIRPPKRVFLILHNLKRALLS
jgi:hypothetical protein